MNRKKQSVMATALAGLLLAVFFIVGYWDLGNSVPKIYINEIMSSNSSTVADDDGDYEDWIELYNPGVLPVNLTGYFLSDNQENPLKWMFPGGTFIKPGGYLLVWASGKDKTGNDGSIHTNFRLSRQGEPIILTSSDQRTRIDFIVHETIPRDVSYGREFNGSSNWVYFDPENASPGKSNHDSEPNNVVLATLNPIFSAERGFYNQGLAIEISARKNTVVYYTLDGSIPTKDSLLYDAPINVDAEVIPVGFPIQIITAGETPRYPISAIQTNPPEAPDRMKWYPAKEEIFKASIIRARAFSPDGNVSEVVTHTYFVDEDMQERYSFPVISLTVALEDFFDFERGIYIPGKVYEEEGYGDSYWGVPNANYHQRGREWERPVHVEFFEADGTLGFSLNAGIRIHGSGSRVLPQKSLRLYARSAYDIQNRIDYDIFQRATQPGKNGAGVTNSFKRLILRNGGQDFYKHIFRDMFLHSLVEHTTLDMQAYRPSVVFLNGEYWGIHTIRERYDRYYLESHYNVEADEVTMLNSNGSLREGEPEDEQHYRDMIAYLKENDMSQTAHYEYIKTQMDVDNYIAYAVFQLYIGNYDWPDNNVNMWRVRTDYNPKAPYGLDGRWRWMITDLDYGFGHKEVSYSSLRDLTLTEEEGSEKRDWSTEIFRCLLDNQEFKNGVINGFADQMNTIFQIDRLNERMDYFTNLFLPEIQEHINRWNRYPSPTIPGWRASIAQMRGYARQRPEHMLAHLAETFGVDERINIVLDVSNPQHGTIRINTIEIKEDTAGVKENAYPWEGEYFQGIPISVTALPKPGYLFAGWQEFEDESETMVITPTADTRITAVFTESLPSPRASITEKEEEDGSVRGKQRITPGIFIILLATGFVLLALLIRRISSRKVFMG